MAALSTGRLVLFLRQSSSLSSASACANATSTLRRSMVAASSVRYYASKKKKPDKKGPGLMEIERLEAKKQLKSFQRTMTKAKAQEAFEEWKARRDGKKRLKEEREEGKGSGQKGSNLPKKTRGDMAAAAAVADTGIGTGVGTRKPWWKGAALSVQDRLKIARGPTLLYAKFSARFLAATYGTSTTFLAISGWTYWANILHAPEGLPWWVQSVNCFAVGAMASVSLGLAYWPTRIIQKIYAVPRGGKLLFVFHRRPLLPLLLPERKIEVDDANKVMFDKPLEPRPGFARITLEAPSRRPEEGVLDTIAKKLPVARLIFDTSKFNGLDVGGGRYQIAKDGWVWEKRGLDTLFASRSERYRH